MKTDWCPKARKVSFRDELAAKMALSRRVWKDKGEQCYYKCWAGGKLHFHLTSMKQSEVNPHAAT